jgi:3alpha(or 20beta)-hydroxysteroid dehydrogenase
MQAVIPAMQANGGGSIVNIASIAALASGSVADAGGVAYGASKGAVRSMSRHAAQSFAKDNIRVNSIYPGPVYTPMVAKMVGTFEMAAESLQDLCPLPPHIGEAIDIANGVLYFASEESRFVTGAELVIDGGFMTQ